MEKTHDSNPATVSAQPRLHQDAPELQPYGTVDHLLPLELEEPVRLEMTERLHRALADTITLRDLYRSLTGRWRVRLFTSSISCLINTFRNNRNWWMPPPNEFNHSAASVWLWRRMWRKPRALHAPLADAKKCPCNCLGCLMHTRSLFAAAVALHLACLE